MSKQIVLFDLPSQPPNKAWSLNPWKTRFALNYKGLDYRTEWVEYPDVKPTLEGKVQPNASDPFYTIPTIGFPEPDGKMTYIMDSRKIANALEERYPTPSLHLDSPTLSKLEAIMPRMTNSLVDLFILAVPTVILNPVSSEYWHQTRSKWVGNMPLKEFVESRGGDDRAFAEMKPLVGEVTALLKEKPEGPFFEGKEVSYADFVWAGLLLFVKACGEEKYEGLLEKAVGGGEDAKLHQDLLEALKPWWERNDH